MADHHGSGHHGHEDDGHDDDRKMVTTTSTPLLDEPRGNVVQQLPAGTRVRVTGEAKHKFFPVKVSGQDARGWIDRDDLAPAVEDGPDQPAGPSGTTQPTAGTGATVPPVVAGDVGARIAAEARKYIGFPYQLGRQGPDTFDCSGLVQFVVRQVTGQLVSPDSHALFNLPRQVEREGLQPGDLVFYDTMGGQEWREGNAISHVGIIVGQNRMVNALDVGLGVRESDPFSSYFVPLYRGARRIF